MDVKGEKKSDSFTALAYRLCGKWVEDYLADSFRDLKPDIQKANIDLSVIEYLSVAVFTSILIFVFEVPLTAALLALLSNAIVGIIGGLMLGLLTATGVFLLFYVYPSVCVGERRKKINESLPFAMFYMTTVAGSGTPPVAMFKMLSQFKEYEEISAEATKITYDVEIAGLSITKALENAASRTPSESLKEIFWGINNNLTTGGDLKSLLYEKANSAMVDYKRNLSNFTSQLSMLTEMYLTAVVVGSIFFMVLSTIMSGFGGSSSSIITTQMIVTFIFLPLASVGFLFILKQIAPAHVI